MRLIVALKLSHYPLGGKLDFERALVIGKRMQLRSLRNFLVYAILVLYVLIPVLDSMVCTDCIGNASLQGKAVICHLQTPHDDVAYTSYDGAQSKTPGGQAAPSFCSICANFLTGIEAFSHHAHTSIAQWDGPAAAPVLSERYHSIHKPPQNILG